MNNKNVKASVGSGKKIKSAMYAAAIIQSFMSDII